MKIDARAHIKVIEIVEKIADVLEAIWLECSMIKTYKQTSIGDAQANIRIYDWLLPAIGLMSCPEIEGFVPVRRLSEACSAANVQAYIEPLVVLILGCSESVAQDCRYCHRDNPTKGRLSYIVVPTGHSCLDSSCMPLKALGFSRTEVRCLSVSVRFSSELVSSHR